MTEAQESRGPQPTPRLARIVTTTGEHRIEFDEVRDAKGFSVYYLAGAEVAFINRRYLVAALPMQRGTTVREDMLMSRQFPWLRG